MRSLADVVKFNAEAAERELQWGDQMVLESALLVDSIDHPDYLNALAISLATTRGNGIDAIMDEFRLDALIAPTAPVPTIIDPWGDDFAGYSTLYVSMAGYPAITIPVGRSTIFRSA